MTLHDVVLLESFPVQIHQQASAQTRAQLQAMPHKHRDGPPAPGHAHWAGGFAHCCPSPPAHAPSVRMVLP